MSPEPQPLGERLASYRHKAQLTAAQVAQAMRVHSDTLSNWERSLTEPRASQLVQLAILYRVAPSDLLGVTA